jgi:hypothetical protein
MVFLLPTISDMVFVLQQKSRGMLIVFCPKFHAVFLNDVIVCRTHVGYIKYWYVILYSCAISAHLKQ